jgi:hypothetical protein
MVDAPPRIDAFIATLSRFDLIDLSRTGATAMPGTSSYKEAAQRGVDHVRHLVVPMNRQLRREK